MDEVGIKKVCDVFGLNYSRVKPNRKRGPQMQISCPLAADPNRHSSSFDEKPSCGVSVNGQEPSKAYCHAASCGWRGSFLDLVREAVKIRRIGRENKHLVDLIKWVKEQETYDLASMLEAKREKVSNAPKTLYAAKQSRSKAQVMPESRLAHMSREYHKYAKFRGLTEKSWDRWDMRFDPRKKAIVFPVRMSNQKLVGMTGRAVNDDDDEPKKNYPGFDKGYHLLGEVFMRPMTNIIIVEGPIDCVNVDAFLGDRACVVATLGEGFSEDQAKLVRGMNPPKVFIFADGDKGGRMIQSKIVDALGKRVVLYSMKTPWGKDPGKLDGETIISLYENAEPVKKMI